MPVIARSDSTAANTMSANLLSGEAFEFLSKNSVITLSITGSAAGLRLFFDVGGDTIANNVYVPATNRFPVYPDDTLVRCAGRAGERLSLRVNNTTAGALTSIVKIDIA